ncbi:MAG TPA: hypothetical protein VGR35_01535 [Tepidisphaeraceae bacterium]|nr:hypothetical protein [Tepidisphaeraceae bacterium]
MPSLSDYVARGKVIAVNDGSVVFTPKDTNYELQLASRTRYDGPVNVPVDARIRAVVRKLLTVPSGGAFVAPIFGPPRTIQGRVRHVEEGAIVVQAGMPFILQLPAADHAMDLNSGPIMVGTMVNAIVLPGVTFELATAPVAASVH